jgi:hypothetical protein
MPAAMRALRSALQQRAKECSLDQKLVEGVNQYLVLLDDYVNRSAKMSGAQADTLMGDILQWHTDHEENHDDSFIRTATYINSCR